MGNKNLVSTLTPLCGSYQMSLESEPFRREVTLLFYSHKALRSCLLVPLGINDTLQTQ